MAETTLQYSNTPSLQFLSFARKPANVILPAAHREALVFVVNFQLFRIEIFWLAMQKREMIPLAEHGEAGRALDHLFNAFSNHSIAMSTHQYRRILAERGGQFVTTLHGANQAHAVIKRRTVRGEKFSIVMHGFELDGQDAEDRAPFRVSMCDTDDFRPRFENTGMDWPLIGRCFGAVQMISIEILHDQSIARDTARTHIGDRNESFGARDAHADVTVPVGDAFVIQDVAGGN